MITKISPKTVQVGPASGPTKRSNKFGEQKTFLGTSELPKRVFCKPTTFRSSRLQLFRLSLGRSCSMVEIEVLEESDSSDSSWEEVVVGVNDEDVDLATTQKAKGPSLSKKKRAASEKTGESVAPPTEPTAPKLATRPSSGAGVTSKKTSQKLDAKNKEKESSGSVLVVALIVVIIALVAFPSLLKTAPSESEEEQVENLYEVLQVAVCLIFFLHLKIC